MYKVEKSVKHIDKMVTWEELGKFKTFKEAKEFAEKNICKDVFHEGRENDSYWFAADNNSPFEPYQVHISFIK